MGVRVNPPDPIHLFLMTSSQIFLFLFFLGLSSALPNPDTDEGGLRDGLKDLGKSVITNTIGSGINCYASTCHAPFYYCDSSNIIRTTCRYTGLTWFLMIGLPLIVIGIIAGVWYWRKKRNENVM